MEQMKVEQLPTLINTLQERLERLEKVFDQFSTSENQKELLTVTEAAQLLDLSVTTIYILKYQKRIPCYKEGGRVYFLRTELIEWITNRPGAVKNPVIKKPKKK